MLIVSQLLAQPHGTKDFFLHRDASVAGQSAAAQLGAHGARLKGGGGAVL